MKGMVEEVVVEDRTTIIITINPVNLLQTDGIKMT